MKIKNVSIFDIEENAFRERFEKEVDLRYA